MKTSTAPRDAVARRTVDRELAIVYGAIELVAAGESSRVTCSGLRFGSQILAGAQAAGGDCGVRVRALWSLDESVSALAIERADPQ